MNILTFSGSYRTESSNSKLLDHLHLLNKEHVFKRTTAHFDLPIFRDGDVPQSAVVDAWKKELQAYDAYIISTPEYIHNMPAVLKNAFEWVTASGELHNKSILPISYTPNAPRGELAMQSLLWTLKALDARIVTSLSIYQNTVWIDEARNFQGEDVELLQEALKLL